MPPSPTVNASSLPAGGAYLACFVSFVALGVSNDG